MRDWPQISKQDEGEEAVVEAIEHLRGVTRSAIESAFDLLQARCNKLLAENKHLLEELKEADKYRLTNKEWEDKYGEGT